MNKRTEWGIALALSVVAVIGTTVPYLLAERLAQPADFSGFLINPLDGFSYLAKMRQGAEGSWLLKLPYAMNPGAGTLVYVYYLFLGHVSRWLGVSLITVFHAARALTSIGMFLAAFQFFRQTLPDQRTRWAAFLLTLFGSGLGWLALPFGLQGSDLSIPESIPFLTAYTNAHFPFTAALMLGGVMAVTGGRKLWARSLIALVCGFLLGAVLPFSLVSLLVALAAWMAWEVFRHGWRRGLKEILLDQRSRILPLLTLSVGAIPWLVYDLWLTRTHPVMATWTAQNQTPSPPLINYLFGYGLVLVLAVVGMFQADLRRDSYGRLLLAWVISNAILLYAPFSLQRRLTLGLFFPLAALAALGLMRLNEKYGRYRVILIGVLILSLPSNLIVVGAGLAGVGQQEAAVVFVQGEREAYKWLSSHAPPGALVLAAPETGNRLPAFADVRVIYGHPFETPYAETQEDRIGELFGWVGSIDEALGALTDLGVDFVFYGKRERALGEPTWLSSLTSIYRSDRFEIFEVGGP